MTARAMQFVGVSTAGSSIHPVFTAWAPVLGLPDGARLVGVDLPLDATPGAYREVVAAMADDPEVAGALVTTHKIGLFSACVDLFEHVSDDAAALGEVSCLVVRGGTVSAHALDVTTSSLALAAIEPDMAGRQVLIMGAGGAGKALMRHLVTRPDPPAGLTITDTDGVRLAAAVDVAAVAGATGLVRTVQVHGPQDDLVAACGPGGLIVNATGMGKDRGGSPISDAVIFPERAIAWDFNYRGALSFLDQARAQRESRSLTVEDGWTYFVHGWTRASARVYDRDIPTDGPACENLSVVARDARGIQ